MTTRHSLSRAGFAAFGTIVVGLVAATASSRAEEPAVADRDWTEIHAKVLEDARQVWADQLASLHAAPLPWDELAGKVARRDAAIAQARRKIESDLAEARARAAFKKHVHDLYAAGMDRSGVLFADAEGLEIAVNRLKSDIEFIGSYIPVVEARIEELARDPRKATEREELERSLEKDMRAPLAARQADLVKVEGRWAGVKAARDAYHGFYEERMKVWMADMGKEEGKVKLLLEDLENVSFDVDEAHPELALSTDEAASWQKGQALQTRLDAQPPAIDPAKASSSCVLCHYTPDESYFRSGTLTYSSHPRVPSVETATCQACHGGEARRTTVKEAHAGGVPARLLAAGEAHDETGLTRGELGRKLWGRHRCSACHDLPGDAPRIRTGSTLDGLNGWAQYEWLVQWLVDPGSYAGSRAMPRYGVSEKDAQKMALYLWQFAHDHSHHHAGPAAKTSEFAGDQRPAEAQGDGHDHEHGAMTVGSLLSGYDVKIGLSQFHKVGCLGCHSLAGMSESVAVVESLVADERRLASGYPPDDDDPVFPAGTVIDEMVLDLLQRDGRIAVDCINEATLDPILIDQRAVLAEGFPAEDPVYPAGTRIDREVYDFLASRRVKKVALAGRGGDFAPELSHAGDKLKKAHLTMWIENPSVHQPEAAMPGFRLSNEDSWLVATYLQTRHAQGQKRTYRRGEWSEIGSVSAGGFTFALSASTPVLAAGPEVLFEVKATFQGTDTVVPMDTLAGLSGRVATGRVEEPWLDLVPFADSARGVHEFFCRFHTPGEARLQILIPSGRGPIEAEFELQIRPFAESLESQGQAAIRDHQCAACHAIPGVEAPPRHDLSAVARASDPEALGVLAQNWVGKVRRHRMPGRAIRAIDGYSFDDAQAEALAAFVLDRLRGEPARDRSARGAIHARAETILERQNCRGCHRVGSGDSDPGTIGPDLSIAGMRFQRGYLARFLAAPEPVRPGDAIMPTFRFAEGEIDDLLLSFQARVAQNTDPAKLVEAAVAAGPGDPVRGAELVKEYRCQTCHLVGDSKKVVDDFTDFTLVELQRHRKRAPRLADLGRRLDPAWMTAWIKDPHRFLPDTPMPDHEFTLQDAASIRDYLLTLTTPASRTEKE